MLHGLLGGGACLVFEWDRREGEEHEAGLELSNNPLNRRCRIGSSGRKKGRTLQ